MSLSTVMREAITLIQLLKVFSVVCDVITTTPEVACKVFEHNQSCDAVAKSKNPQERTKHIAIKHHEFRILFDKTKIKINYIDTKKKLSDILN